MADAPRYSIQDLADLADVSRRTVRYYVQEQLLPAPFGVGRGPHYGPQHLDRLLQVKALQAAGQSLDEIRVRLGGGAPLAAARSAAPAPERSVWRRIVLAPGVEIHVASSVSLPGPGRLHELADWCRLHFTPSSSE